MTVIGRADIDGRTDFRQGNVVIGAFCEKIAFGGGYSFFAIGRAATNGRVRDFVVPMGHLMFCGIQPDCEVSRRDRSSVFRTLPAGVSGNSGTA